MLDAYKNNKDNPNLVPLNIIGKGPDSDAIDRWIKDNGMQEIIKMHGAIYDDHEKANYFARAYACISPLQAGLSVLESMGYGVPFVTVKDAITGGESFNIHSNVDGVVMNSVEELSTVVADIFNNKRKYIDYGKMQSHFMIIIVHLNIWLRDCGVPYNMFLINDVSNSTLYKGDGEKPL